jgi:hypothetical protein
LSLFQISKSTLYFKVFGSLKKPVKAEFPDVLGKIILQKTNKKHKKLDDKKYTLPFKNVA